MHVQVNGVRLFFDVEGAKLAPDGAAMCERPTLLLLHGGPGYDHSWFKPSMSAFCGIAQIVYLDHRGAGRSEPGPRDNWTLDQWADDVHGFCAAIGIEKPIVLGDSFGGFVAQAYAVRYPDHPSKLVLSVTGPRFDRSLAIERFRALGGAAAGVAAAAYLNTPSPETMAGFLETCGTLLTATGALDGDRFARIQGNPELTFDFFRTGGGADQINLGPSLKTIRCPTLIVSGAKDPIIPAPLQAELYACLSPGIGRVVHLANTGHFVTDEWQVFEKALRGFILEAAG